MENYQSYEQYLWSLRRKKSIVMLSAAIVLNEMVTYENRNKSRPQRKNPRFWVRPMFRIEKRNEQGHYRNLIQEMRLSDSEMHFNYFRMSKELFDVLLKKVGPRITKRNCVREPLPAGLRLAATLRYLATGDCMRTISFDYRIGKTTVSQIILETCESLWQVLKDEVLPPPSAETWKEVADDFLHYWDFSNCIGAIDGKHILIQAPSNSGSDFFNYKKTYSIVLLAVANAQYQFISVDVGAKRKQSDGGIFKHSKLGHALFTNSLNLPPPEPIEYGDEDIPFFLTADEAFPLRINIMRPYPGNFLNQQKRIFNYRLGRARRVIENAFGILSARWRILASVERVEVITLSTLCLHNFLLSQKRKGRFTSYCPIGFADREDEFGILIPEEWRSERRENLLPARQLGTNTYSRNASQIREYLSNYFMTEGSLNFQWDKE